MSLCATLIVRVICGPLVDREYIFCETLPLHLSYHSHITGYGPRKVMAGILIIGAIPSGLAGTVSTVNGLYIVRFFIGILGGTFVSCEAWNTAFFDKNVVGSGEIHFQT